MHAFRCLIGAAGFVTLSAASSKPVLLQQWREIPISIDAGRMNFVIREKLHPPPFGCVLWPAGRVLLDYALKELPPESVVIEVGSGCGLTAIGIALARPSIKVIATDRCNEALKNLEHNVQCSDLSGKVDVLHWNVADNNHNLPFDVSQVTDIIAADIIYGTGADDGLVHSLARLFGINPNLRVHLLLVERYGAESEGVGFDSSITNFEAAFGKEGPGAGLDCTSKRLPESILSRATARSNYWWSHASWWFSWYYATFHLYRISKLPRVQE